jgi:hemerythrin-like domain-containing protein
MHPTDILSQEHRAIERMMDRLESQIANDQANHAFARSFYDEALDFFRNFADGVHHAKEENLLFVRLEERGMSGGGGPIGVMLAEHDQGRAYLRGVREHLEAAEAGSADARRQVFANAAGYIGLLRQHIMKEDNILFRMARMILRPDDVVELTREFAAVEVPERFLSPAA